MACLAYKPTAVTTLDGSVVARQDAVELQSKISESLDTIQATKNERQRETLNRFEAVEKEIRETKQIVEKLGENTVIRYTQDHMSKTFSHLNEARLEERINPYNVTIRNNGDIVDGEVDSAENGSQTQRTAPSIDFKLPNKRLVFSTRQQDA